MEKDNCPLVSVPVVTYNSSKTVLETLESIKVQTYQNIELIVSDDCSTDDTVEICRKWIAENEKRFVRTVLLESPVNTGISANGNRANEACRGEWVKGIAGDDILMPECISRYVSHVLKYPDAVYLFSRMSSFGTREEVCREVDKIFDYSFFELSKENQLERLIFGRNCIPAPTSFYNRSKVASLNIINDERIPLLEDWPRWINLLRIGISFGFVDEVLVRYRIGGISTAYLTPEKSYRSYRTFVMIYLFPEWVKKKGEQYAISRIVDEECDNYCQLINLFNEVERIKSSKSFVFHNKYVRPIMDYFRGVLGKII